MAKMIQLSVALIGVVLCLAVTSRAAKNFTAPAEKCGSLEVSPVGQPHEFTFPGFCFKFECEVTVVDEDYHQGKLKPIGCPAVSAIAPCTIQRENTSLDYPQCCPHRTCPNDNKGR